MTTYEMQGGCTYKITDDGERLLIANFEARIIREVRMVDGINTETSLTIRGKQKKGALPDVTVPGNNFHTMTWVMQLWGTSCIIYPIANVRDDLRAAIQTESNAEVKTIYRYIGWNDTAEGRQYLHKGGAITAKGNDPNVTVTLPAELSRYDIKGKVSEKEAFLASIDLLHIMPPEIGWVMWTATFTPLLGPVDFAVHVTGRTGSFKSEMMSLWQSHYGDGMDARHLPGSWSSTANALEAQAYFAANAVFVVDDFVPTGTTWQQKSYQTNADKLIRAQGNQAGRARLTDTSHLQQTYYPRGIIFSTGEDTPEGHSVRARMMIMELSPGDITPENLTLGQMSRSKYQSAVFHIIKHICNEGSKNGELESEADEIRNNHLSIGHTRTPGIIGRLVATGRWLLRYAHKKKILTAKEIEEYEGEMVRWIVICGEKQKVFLETADPIEIFKSGLRQTLGANISHLRTYNGGIPPKPVMMGWSVDNIHEDPPTYRSHGPCIGWVRRDKNELYLEINLGYNAVKKACGNDLTLSKQTLLKRLKDASLITRIDEGRGRNTVRLVCDGHLRQVMVLALDKCFEMGDDE